MYMYRTKRGLNSTLKEYIPEYTNVGDSTENF